MQGGLFAAATQQPPASPASPTQGQADGSEPLRRQLSRSVSIEGALALYVENQRAPAPANYLAPDTQTSALGKPYTRHWDFMIFQYEFTSKHSGHKVFEILQAAQSTPGYDLFHAYGFLLIYDLFCRNTKINILSDDCGHSIATMLTQVDRKKKHAKKD
jgi:hypothetical protein